VVGTNVKTSPRATANINFEKLFLIGYLKMLFYQYRSYFGSNIEIV